MGAACLCVQKNGIAAREFVIFNMHADVDQCDYTWGLCCATTVGESALKVDSEEKFLAVPGN